MSNESRPQYYYEALSCMWGSEFHGSRSSVIPDNEEDEELILLMSLDACSLLAHCYVTFV